ncbi:MAG: hypothetical protein F6K35_45050, partial [Okeania sp. SIO2H7]|nr:hypothetical protein [Okeania sp. SIO2H7]
MALNPDIQFSFREQVEPVYRELVSLLLREKDASQANLRQARDVIESLQLAELDNFFRDTCAKPQQVNIGAVDPTAAVFYPILLDNPYNPSPENSSGRTSGQTSQRLEVILQVPAPSSSAPSSLHKAGRPVLPQGKGSLEGEGGLDRTTLIHISQTFDHQD